MWSSRLVLCLLLGGAALADHHQQGHQEQQNAWKSGSEYKYEVEGRTLAALHQVADQYTGMLMKAELTVQPKSGNTLRAKISKAEYAQIHTELPGGWDSEIPETKLSYKKMPLSGKPFEIKLKNGAIDDLIIDQKIPKWEVNVLKSVASQLQVDTQGENLIKSKYSQRPEGDQVFAAYKTMEDSVTGKCEVNYDISPLPDYVLHSKPELAPLPQLRGNGQMIDVVKSKNLSHCHEPSATYEGLSEINDEEPDTKNSRHALSRSSVSRIILSGSLNRYTIQSSVTTNKVILSPNLHEEQNGMVVSRLNLTLAEVSEASNSISAPSNPQATGNLIYRHHADLGESQDDDSSSSSYESGSDSSSNSDSSSSSDSGSSSSSSSEEEQYKKRHRRGANRKWDSEKESLKKAPKSEWSTMISDNDGSSDQQSLADNVVRQSQEMAKQIGNEVQNPSEIPEKQTLEKFNILVQLIRLMNAERIDQAQQSLYQPADKTNPNSQSDSSRRSAWAAYRDAVAAAGTGPALLNIKQWIEQRKIQGAEAAEVVATLPEVCRSPTPEYMDTFFSMATSLEVSRQAYLNSSAILAFTELTRMAQMNNGTAHNHYPVSGLAGQSSKDHSAVSQRYIPYLARELKSAIHDADSPKILVYIRALGNLGNPQILRVFEPYLEGEKDASDFQRLAMVIAMDKLTQLYPRLAQSVLYKIYRNTGAPCEVRCAAVFQLMKTNPPAGMLQRMAQFTNWDMNKQVNSAVRSAIENAAELESDGQTVLAENARAARDMLSPKTHGLQYSQSYLRDYVIDEMNLAYKLSALSIGSDDSIIPQGVYASLRTMYGDYKAGSSEIGAMVSSIDQLSSFISDQVDSNDAGEKQSQKQKQNTGNGKWTPEKLAKLLRIESESSEQLEGQLMLNSINAKHFFAFDNHTIERIPDAIRKAAQALKMGQSFNATKFGDNNMYLSFPTEMGFPFFYVLSRPTLFKIGGEAKAQSTPDLARGSADQWKIPSTVNATADVHMVYSAQVQAEMGFVTPFDYQKYAAGVTKNFQINLLLRVAFDIDAENQHVRIKMGPLQGNQEHHLVHYSTKPWTTKFDLRSLTPIALEKNTQPIYSEEPNKNEYTFGEQSTGMIFSMKTSSEGDAEKNMWAFAVDQLAPHDAISAVVFPWAQRSIKGNSYDLVLDSVRSSAKAVVLTASWNSQRYAGGENGEGSSADIPQPSSQKPDSQERQKEIQDQAASGINDAEVTSVDFGMEFDGSSNAHWVATAAWAESNADPKSRVLFYWHKKSADQKTYEVCARAESEVPNGPELDFAQALKTESTSKIDVAVRFGEDCKSGAVIEVQGKMEQSSDLREYLREQPMAQQCAKQMEEGDYALPACRNLTTRANQMDQAHFTIKYNNVPVGAKSMVAGGYRFAHVMAYPNAYENVIDPEAQEDNRIDIDFELGEDLQNMNVSINAPSLDAAFTNVEVADWAQPLIAVDTVRSASERLGRHAMNGQYNPTCVLDNNSANTFDNKTYPIDLGNCWHVVFTAVAQEDPDNYTEDLDIPEDMQVSVIARDVSENEKEVKITMGEDEVTFSPSQSGPEVQVNDQKVEVSQDKSYAKMDDEEEEAIFEIYGLPDGSVKLSSDEYGIDAVYDGSRVKISAAQKYRSSIRGMCGTFTGQSVDDFTTPENCILKNPEEFSASYALTGEQCDGPAQRNAQKAKQSHCYRKEHYLGNVVSHEEAGRQKPKSTWGGSQQNKPQKQQKSYQGNCHTHETKVVRQNGQTCFSLRPVPACSPKCRSVEKTEKNISFHCVDDGETAAKFHQHIRNGGNPDFSRKQITQTIKMAVSTSCSAK